MQVEPEEKAEKTSEAETKCEKKESEAKTAAPHKLRIGPEKHKYVYTRLTDVAYKCRRGSEYATAGHVRFLVKLPNGQWNAYDGINSDDGAIPPMSDPIFTSYEDVLLQGWHSWRMQKWDGRESPFMTTVL